MTRLQSLLASLTGRYGPGRVTPAGGSIRITYTVWFLILVGLVGSLLYLSANLVTDPPTTREQRWLPALQIAAVIAFTAYLPILLLISFFRSERERAQVAATSEAATNGWTTEFQGQINEWYARVFDKRRYPIPATLALVTFIAAWTFMFFHNGPAIGDLMAGGMNGLAQQIATGPPLSYGFLGAYFFAISFLFRRYMSGDLGPGAYLNVAIRTWLVAILTIVVARIADVSAIETTAAGETAKAAISAAAFLGAFTPAAVLNKIRDAAKAVLSLGDEWKPETPITVIDGINPWKAARLAEEGIDNVQNLALDQPSRLFVVTREGSLRVLDWMDQAILLNAATGVASDLSVKPSPGAEVDELRLRLRAMGIRRATDLFLALRTNELIEPVKAPDGTVTWAVKVVDQSVFPDIAPLALRYVATSIVNHPSFENIRQMRDQALRTAAKRFPMSTQEMSPRQSTSAASEVRAGLNPSVLLVERKGMGPAASAVLVDDRIAVTTRDVDPAEIGFRAVDDPGHVVSATLVTQDEATHLAMYRLAESIGTPAHRAAADPAPGDTLNKESHLSGIASGQVIRIVPSMELVSGFGNISIANLLEIAMPAVSGEAGAPLFDALGDLAAVLVGGSPERTVAVQVSRLPKTPQPRRRRVGSGASSGSGNGAATPG